MSDKNPTKKIRYAVVGLGHIAQTAVLPGFKNAANAELTALVSGDPVKLKTLGKKYGAQIVCGYEDYDGLLASGDIDAVYVATPNTLHQTFIERAARKGIHVLCEKPLAGTPAACQQIINVAEENNVKLMVAYRLHFDPGNLMAIETAQSGKLGDLRMFNSLFSYNLKDDKNIRLKANLAGGAIFDIGIYCINASRYIFEDEPREVFAFTSSNSKDRRFDEVPEMWTALMKFSKDRVASFTVSFAASTMSHYEIVGSKGSLRLNNAYEYAVPMEMVTTINEKSKKTKFKKHDQFGPELFYFSNCILRNEQPEPSGLEGLADLRIIEALQTSADSGISIEVESVHKTVWPSMRQEITRPGIKAPPKPVHATSPSGN
jgi:predicted dehydrogenase